MNSTWATPRWGGKPRPYPVGTTCPGAVRSVCVFSTIRKTKIGMGSSARTRTTRVLWFVEQTGEESFEARKINPRNVPAGNAEIIPLHRLVNDFTPELAYFEDVVLPAMLELEDILDQETSTGTRAVSTAPRWSTARPCALRSATSEPCSAWA